MMATPSSSTRPPSAPRRMSCSSLRARSNMRRPRASTCTWPPGPAGRNASPSRCCLRPRLDWSIGRMPPASATRLCSVTLRKEQTERSDPSFGPKPRRSSRPIAADPLTQTSHHHRLLPRSRTSSNSTSLRLSSGNRRTNPDSKGTSCEFACWAR